MNENERVTERIWATIEKDRYDKLRQYADEVGIQFSQYIAMVSWMGAVQLRRTMHPEQYISGEVMAEAIAKSISGSFDREVLAAALSQAMTAMTDKLSGEDIKRMMELPDEVIDADRT